MLKFKTSILTIHWYQTTSKRGYEARESQLQEQIWGWGIQEKADGTGGQIWFRIADLLAGCVVMYK